MESLINKISAKTLYQEILIFVSGVVLLFACSQIYIPLDPVPITMQSVGIVVLGLLYNLKKGLGIYTLYLVLGAMGVPMFAGFAAGVNTIFGLRFGYFLGFAIAIYTMNLIKIKIGLDSFIKIALNCACGTLLIFIFGILWLTIFLGFNKAIIVGFMPFIIPGIIKIIALSGILRILRITKVNP